MPQSNEHHAWMGPVSPIPRDDSSTGIAPQDSDPSELDSVAHWRVKQSGVDTVVFRFKLADPIAINVLGSATPFGVEGSARFKAGKSLTLRDPLTGKPTPVEVKANGRWIMNLGWAQVIGYPNDSLVNVDCRPAALLARDSAVAALLAPAEMRKAASAARELVGKILDGNDPGADPDLRRVDVAVDLRNRSSAPDAGNHGEVLLRAFAGSFPPRWHPVAHPRKNGHRYLGGVTFRTNTGNQIVFRAYDKGFDLSLPKHKIRVEADAPDSKPTYEKHPESCEPGLLLRLERQWRPTKTADSLTLDQWDGTDVRKLFLGQFGKWQRGLRPPLVCGTRAAEDFAQRLFEGRQITRRRLNTLLGQIAILHDQVFDDSQEHRNNANRDAEESLRKEGLVLNNRLPRHAGIRLGDLILMAADSLPQQPQLPDPPDWFSE